MVEREKPLGSNDASTTGVAMSGSEATTGGEVEAIAVGAVAKARRRKPLLPL